MDYDDEVAANPNAMVVSIYDPSPSRAYVKLIKAELPRTQEALTKALEDWCNAEKKVIKWHLVGDFFYKKFVGFESPSSHSPPRSLIHLSSDSNDSGDKFLRKIDEEVVRQKREKN